MNAATDERRRHRRVKLDGRTLGRATVFTEFRVVALSESGAAIETAIPLLLDSRCDLTVHLSNLTVDLKGRVAHVQPPEGPGGPFVVGVEFVEMDEIDQALLESFLEREREAH